MLEANVDNKDAAGRYVYDRTSNIKWKRELLADVISQRKSIAKKKAAKQEANGTSASTKKSDTNTALEQPNDDDHAVSDEAERNQDRVDDTEERMSQLTQWMKTLYRTSTAPASEREMAATAAVNMVDSIRADIQYFAQERHGGLFTRDVVFRKASVASRVLFLLNKLYRQLPASTRDLLPDDTAFGKLKQRAGPAGSFDDFMLFGILTATLFKTSRSLPQAQEVLQLVERRLLKHKPHDEAFRTSVAAYLSERRRIGFEPLVGASPEAQRVFKWFAPIDGGTTAVLDQLGSYEWLRCLDVGDDTKEDSVDRLCKTMAEAPRQLMLCVRSTRGVIVAAHSPPALNRAIEAVISVAGCSGVLFRPTSDCDNAEVLVVDGLDARRLAMAAPSLL